jgi:hypothetical protein
MKANPTTKNMSNSLLSKYGKEEITTYNLYSSDHQTESLLLPGGRIIDDRGPTILPRTEDAFPGNSVVSLHGRLPKHDKQK